MREEANVQQTVSHSPPAPRSWIERLWSSIADRGRPYAALPSDAVPGLERAQLLAQALLSSRGEASGAALARELHTVLDRLSREDRLGFLRYVATGFLPDPVALRAAAQAYLATPDDPVTAGRLAEAVEPPRQELLRRMNMAPGGTAALVAMRKALLGLLRENPDLKALDADLRHLLGSWFNRGFLELRRIDWQTPAAVLEKLITYEAVHEIQGWNDLRRRLAPDRRCFGFFHPALPGEPLIFVEVALHEGLAAAVQPLLAPESDESMTRAREAKADTAIFYSISNCEDGLRGVSFGNFLIKQVVEELKAELPGLRRFATLSPVPGFRRWFDKRLDDAGEGAERDVLQADERSAIFSAASMPEDADDDVMAMHALLQTEKWWEYPAREKALHQPLLRACAIYLTQAGGGNGPADPVARFHLGNGARLEQVNWLGNVAPRGIKESYGIMVNYVYDLPTIEANHEMFVRDGTIVRSPSVDALIAPPSAPKASRRGLRRLGRLSLSHGD
jgi:malonyl-CoA decarboxylase